MPYLIARGRQHDFSARVSLPEIAPGEVRRIGRADEVEIRLPDRSVSKVHASLQRVEDGRFLITDLGSKNGLHHGGRRRSEITVAVGEEFRLGNLLLTISGDGPATFPIPDSVPKPSPAEHSSQRVDDPSKQPAAASKTAAAAGSRRATGDERVLGASQSDGVDTASRRRWIPIVVLLAVVLTAILGWALPGWLAGSDDANESDSPNVDPVTAAEAEDESTANGEETTSEVVIPSLGTVRVAASDHRKPLAILGRELDQKCSTAGCHVTSSEVEFRVSETEDWGRWSRNLLRARARKAGLRTTDRGWVVPAFATVAPHQEDLPVTLSLAAAEAVDTLRSVSALVGTDAAEFGFADLAEFDGVTIARQRRVWRTLFGRDPSLTELIDSVDSSLPQLVELARTKAEFWDERARTHLRGRGTYAADGSFVLPGTLTPHEVPGRPELWFDMLQTEIQRAGELTPHPYGDSPPFAENGDDSAHVGWLLERVTSHDRPTPPDHGVRSIWTVLWGRPPSVEEDRLLRAVVAESPADAQAWSRVTRALLYSPSMPFPSPPRGTEVEWVQGVTRWLLGRELESAAVEAVAASVAAGSLDPRLLLEACLSSREFATRVGPETKPNDTAATTIRIEVFGQFSPRALLADPARAPRLWKLCERSIVQLFPTDRVNLEGLAPRALARRDAESPLAVVSHLGLVPTATTIESAPMVLADGFLTPALRRLADRIGDARVLAPPPANYEWLLGQLRVAPPRVDQELTALRLAGYRFEADRWEAKSQQPATRTLLVANGLSRWAGNLTAWIRLRGALASAEDRVSEWREFVDALEILSAANPASTFDLWLWGTVADGSVETVRFRWGHDIDRGWVQRESQPGRVTHPELQFEKFQGDGR